MAYVFSGLNSLLGQEDEQNKQNIFAPEESQMGNQQSGEQQPGAAPKTSTEGDLGGGGNTGGTQTSEAKPAAQTQTTDSRLMQRNKVKAVPGFATKAQTDLDTAQQSLQSEADSYMQGAKSKTYDVGEADLEKAVGGDQDATTKVRGLLTGQADRAEAFQPKTDYEIEDAYDLQSDAGVDNLLRRSNGAEYNAGEAALDRSLLNRSTEFNQLRSLLKGKQEGLTKQADEWTGASGKTKEAQDAIEANYKAAQGKASGYLDSQDDVILQRLKDAAAAENATRAGLRTKADSDYVAAQAQAATKKLMEANPEMAEYFRGSRVDADQYYGVAGDVDYRDLASDADAQRYNGILSLLGRGAGADDITTAGRGAGDRQGFNEQAYRDAVFAAGKSRYEGANAAKGVGSAMAAKAADAIKAATDAKARADAEAAAKAAAEANKPAPPPPEAKPLPGPKGDANPSGYFIGTGDGTLTKKPAQYAYQAGKDITNGGKTITKETKDIDSAGNSVDKQTGGHVAKTKKKIGAAKKKIGLSK